MKNIFLVLNNVISILDLFKILTYYIDDKKILEIGNKNINKDNIFFKFCRVAFLKNPYLRPWASVIFAPTLWA